jgi:hypothetical protein
MSDVENVKESIRKHSNKFIVRLSIGVLLIMYSLGRIWKDVPLLFLRRISCIGFVLSGLVICYLSAGSTKVIIDNAGNGIVAGHFSNTITVDRLSKISNGGCDLFLWKGKL